MIPPNSTVNLVVQFSANKVGRYSEVLVFDVLNGEKTNKVTVMASCDYPRINTEARCGDRQTSLTKMPQQAASLTGSACRVLAGAFLCFASVVCML